ncbi:response regulator transcription factor [Roseinatronobacter sp. NSM]|uniref:response regulator transcription factor n=1 Tax=Roseinatronobacter sp. NSM TaxID=3457785 RepID=UPI00403759B0
MRFLLIEDNQNLAQTVLAQLGSEGHGVDHATNLSEAEACLAAAQYDLILLDITLPDGDGRSFLKRRRAQLATPIIVMTARSEVSDRVGTLDLGADDYITKPFDFEELKARCRAVLRRQGHNPAPVLHFADMAFNPMEATVTIAGEVRTLRNRELRLLEVLLAGAGRIFSKDQLCDRLFSFDEAVSDNAIEVYVARLRRKLDGSGARIETVRGIGYRLVA